LCFIRENITPRGDGNSHNDPSSSNVKFIRENITPRGDGNKKWIISLIVPANITYKREYNSERRRKLL